MNNDNRIKLVATEWFGGHIVAHKTDDRLIWSAPNRSTYRCNYIIDGSVLLVSGDIGMAIYRWTNVISWDFLASTDLDYFVGKCCASETGRDFKQWDGRVLAGRLKERLGNRANTEAGKRLIAEAMHSLDVHEWTMIAREHSKFLGEFWYEVGDLGEVIHIRAIGHWVGIQMAMQSKGFAAKYLA